MRKGWIPNLIGVSAAAMFGLLVSTSTASAQPPQQQQQPVPDVSEQQLETFAETYLAVRDLQEELEAEMGQVSDPQEAQTVQQNYNDRILSTIEDHGLTPDEYQSLVTAVNQDEQIRDRFFAVLEELEEEREG